jgi:hypothetical protein
VTDEAVTDEAVTGEAVTGEAVTGEAVTGEAVTVFVTSAIARRHQRSAARRAASSPAR